MEGGRLEDRGYLVMGVPAERFRNFATDYGANVTSAPCRRVSRLNRIHPLENQKVSMKKP